MLEDNECIALPVTCGPGTHEAGGTCAPDVTQYLIRASRQIVAGAAPARVYVFGRSLDGTPATDQIVLNTNRPGSGTFAPATLTLDDRGGTTTFVACDSATPGCLGPLQLTVALASAPATPVAQFEVELIAPPRIGSIDPCLTGGNVLYLEGNGFVYRGALTVIDASFEASGGSQRGAASIVPVNALQGTEWSLEFTTVQLGMPLVPGVYLDAFQVPPAGKPGMKVFGQTPYAACSEAYRGDFQIHAYELTTSSPRMTVSFEQWCNTPTNVVSGCVHLE